MAEKVSLIFTGFCLGVLVVAVGLAVALQTGLFASPIQQEATSSASPLPEPKVIQQTQPREGQNFTPTPTNPPANTPIPTPTTKPTYYSGPQLWEAVNQARVANGVNPLKQLDLLCTIASIRLNHQLALGTLDNHARFEETVKSVQGTGKYTIGEFLVAGYPTAQAAVDAWYNTLGHKKLITGGEFIWGCTYAQDGFGVAIAAY